MWFTTLQQISLYKEGKKTLSKQNVKRDNSNQAPHNRVFECDSFFAFFCNLQIYFVVQQFIINNNQGKNTNGSRCKRCVRFCSHVKEIATPIWCHFCQNNILPFKFIK